MIPRVVRDGSGGDCQVCGSALGVSARVCPVCNAPVTGRGATRGGRGPSLPATPAPPPVPAPAVASAAGSGRLFASTVLSVDGVSKRFGEGDVAVVPVRDVSFGVSEGEIVLIMGPSGSGKTTLLLMLGAMLRPSSGSVVVGGVDLATASPRRLPGLRAKHLGFIFQDFNLLGSLSALENVEYALNLAGIRGRVARGRAEALLERVGLSHRLHSRPGVLSGGEQQRVAIARALANDPPLLLADEPTANLDAKNGKGVGELLRRLATEEGRSCVIVTHDDRLEGIADRVLWLDDGVLRDRPSGYGRIHGAIPSLATPSDGTGPPGVVVDGRGRFTPPAGSPVAAAATA